MSDAAAGDALVTRIGWETDAETGEQIFTATLVFPHGPPELPCNIVWNRVPIRIVKRNPLQSGDNSPRGLENDQSEDR